MDMRIIEASSLPALRGAKEQKDPRRRRVVCSAAWVLLPKAHSWPGRSTTVGVMPRWGRNFSRISLMDRRRVEVLMQGW